MDLHYREGVMIEDLGEGECTVRPMESGGVAWWELWLRSRRSDNGELDTFAVPVLPGGTYREGSTNEAGKLPRLWGCNRGETADAWVISPSINVLISRVLHPGEHPTEVSIWHQNVVMRDVPHDAQWIGRQFP